MHAINNKDSNQTAFSYLLFLLWPFMAVIVSLRNNRQTWAKNVVWLFIVFYGFNFVIPNDGADGYAYQARFIEIAHQEISAASFSEYLNSERSSSIDILEPFISYTLAQFTDDPRMLFAVYGLIFGFFYSRNMWYVLEHNYKWTYVNVLIFILFAFSVGIWQINGFRFWCAAHIFFYGVFPFVTEKKKKYVVFILLSAFMHFAFLLPIAIFMIYYFAGNRSQIYFIFFLVTFFIAELDIGAIREVLMVYLPDVFSSKIDAYTSDKYVEVLDDRSANSTIFNLINSYVSSFVRASPLFIIYFKLRKHKESKVLYNLLCFTLLFYAFANILMLLPSGPRFMSIASLFTFALVFIYLQYVPHRFLQRFIYVISPLAFYVIVYTFRIIGKDTFSVYSFSNPIVNLLF